MSSTPRSCTELSDDPSWYVSVLAEVVNPGRSRTEMTLVACRARVARLASIRHDRRTSDFEPSIWQTIADEKKQFHAAISAQQPELPTISVKVLAELKRIREENRACRRKADAAQKDEGAGIHRIGPTVYRHGSRVYDVGAYGGDPRRMESLLRPETQCHVPRRRVAPTADHNRVINLRAAVESKRRRDEKSSRRPPLSSKSLRVLENLRQAREDNRSQSVRKKRLPPIPLPPSVIKKARLSQIFKAREDSAQAVTHLKESTAASIDVSGRTGSDLDVNVNMSLPSPTDRGQSSPRNRKRWLEGLFEEPCIKRRVSEDGRSPRVRRRTDSDLDLNVITSLPPSTGRGQSICCKPKQLLDEPNIKKRKSKDRREKNRSHITCQPKKAIASASITNQGFGFTVEPAVCGTPPTRAVSFADIAIDSRARGNRQCGTQGEEPQGQPASNPVCLQAASVQTAAVLAGKPVSGRMSTHKETDSKVADNACQDSRCDKSQSSPGASLVSVERASLNVAVVSKSINDERVLPLVNTGPSLTEVLFARPVPDSEPPAMPRYYFENVDDINGSSALPVVNAGPSRSEILLARPVPDSEPPVMPRRDFYNADDAKREGLRSNGHDLPAASPASVQWASLTHHTTSQEKGGHSRRGGKLLPKDSFWAGVNKFLNG